MIYAVAGVALLQIMTLGAIVHLHIVTEERLATERRRSEGLTAAVLSVSGETVAAKMVVGDDPVPINYRRRPANRQIGMTARR